MDTLSHIVRWDVPFAEAEHLSVSLITERFGGAATLVVAPLGIYQYPKYLVRFDKVLAVLYYEEALALGRDYPKSTDASGCAFVWADSPWLRASHGWAVVFLQWPDVRDYIIFGADDVVELLASGVSKVERIDEKTVLETKHEVNKPDRANRRQPLSFLEPVGEFGVRGLTAAAAHPGRWP